MRGSRPILLAMAVALFVAGCSSTGAQSGSGSTADAPSSSSVAPPAGTETSTTSTPTSPASDAPSETPPAQADVAVPDNPLCHLITVDQAAAALGSPISQVQADEVQCSYIHGPMGDADHALEVTSGCGEEYGKWHDKEHTVPGEPNIRINKDIGLAFVTVGKACYGLLGYVDAPLKADLLPRLNAALVAAATSMVHNAKG